MIHVIFICLFIYLFVYLFSYLFIYLIICSFIYFANDERKAFNFTIYSVSLLSYTPIVCIDDNMFVFFVIVKKIPEARYSI